MSDDNVNATENDKAYSEVSHFSVFPDKRDDQNTKDTAEILSHIVTGSVVEYHRVDKTIGEITDSSAISSNADVTIGETKKLYAFTNVDSQNPDKGCKGFDSYYYMTENQLQTFIDHGLINLDTKTFNTEAIADILGLPPGNKLECLVELSSSKEFSYTEVPIGPVTWIKKTISQTESQIEDNHTIVEVETFEKRGGGKQAIPHAESAYQLNDKIDCYYDENGKLILQLPIAEIVGMKCDFKEFQQDNTVLSEEKRTEIIAELNNNNVKAQDKVDTILQTPVLEEHKTTENEQAINPEYKVNPLENNTKTAEPTHQEANKTQEYLPANDKLVFPDDNQSKEQTQTIGKLAFPEGDQSKAQDASETKNKLVFQEDAQGKTQAQEQTTSKLYFPEDNQTKSQERPQAKDKLVFPEDKKDKSQEKTSSNDQKLMFNEDYAKTQTYDRER